MYTINSIENPEHASPKFEDVFFFARRTRILKILFQVSFVCVLQNKIVTAPVSIIPIESDQVRGPIKLSKSFHFVFVVLSRLRMGVCLKSKRVRQGANSVLYSISFKL